MPIFSEVGLTIIITIAVAFIVTFATTPVVRTFAEKVGAMDIPDEERRIHDHPIPRMGGLAIFLGFLIAVLLFAKISSQIQGILLGSIIIVVTGAIDDIISLKAWVKLLLQIAAACVPVLYGVRIEILMNPALWSQSEYLILGNLSIPITILWIVGITNSVNLIDGLDGLAVGVSAISSITMLVIALLVADSNVAIILAALVGACVGFMPYNMNPAKIFMGDTGALLLGYILSTMSILGLFKFYAVVSFAVPLLALAVPLFDTIFSFFRRLFKGQSPFHADRGHLHHRLLDMGFSQKQAVAILYSISAILGLAAVVITTRGELRALILIIGFCLCVCLWLFVYKEAHKAEETDDTSKKDIPKDVDPSGKTDADAAADNVSDNAQDPEDKDSENSDDKKSD